MRKLALGCVLSAVIAASIVSPVGALAASPTGIVPHSVLSASTCDGTFHTVPSPNLIGANFLISTSVISANDIWAVGDSTSATGYDQTIAEHWDGNTWRIIPTPNFGKFDNDLNGVVAISANDVWAVGDWSQTTIPTALVATALHWNGSTWTTYSFQPSGNTALLAVTAISSTDVWAVGTADYAGGGGNGVLTLAEHWNGSSWSQFATPSPSVFDSELFAVSAWSSTDVWAVGRQQSAVGNSPVQGLAEHWDGSTWSVVTTPNSTGDNEIFGVTALEAGHAVGVGYGNYVFVSSTPRRSEAWNLLSAGGSTNDVSLGGSALNSNNNALQEVARSGAGLWAVGYQRATLTAPRQNVVISATWNATAHTLTWSSVGSAANPSAINDVLFGVAAISPYQFWAAGYENNSSNTEQTLTEFYCAIHFGLTAPASTTAGSAFSLTVTAQNGDGTTSTGYRGRVHFTSTDPSAVLPADYTFTPGDNGSHTFAGIVLTTPGGQTITTSDLAMPFTTPGSVVVAVACLGTCPGPPGNPPTRNPVVQVPGGTAGSRGPVNQSGASTGGPRVPQTAPQAVGGATARPATVVATTSAASATAVAAAQTQPRAAARAVGVVEADTAVAPAASLPAVEVAARGGRAVPAPEEMSWLTLLFIPLFLSLPVLVGLRRRYDETD